MLNILFYGIINKKWSGIEVVITSYTGTVVVLQRARGFESHPLRQFFLIIRKRGFEKERTRVSRWAGAIRNEGENRLVDDFATRPKGIPPTPPNNKNSTILKYQRIVEFFYVVGKSKIFLLYKRAKFYFVKFLTLFYCNIPNTKIPRFSR